MISHKEADKRLMLQDMDIKIATAKEMGKNTFTEAFLDLYVNSRMPSHEIIVRLKIGRPTLNKIVDTLKCHGYDLDAIVDRGKYIRKKISDSELKEIMEMSKSMTAVAIRATGKYKISVERIRGLIRENRAEQPVPKNKKMCLGYGHIGKSCGNYARDNSLFCRDCFDRMKRPGIKGKEVAA